MQESLDLINELALWDEAVGWLQWPKSVPAIVERFEALLLAQEDASKDECHKVLSLDIDLTLDVDVMLDPAVLIDTKVMRIFQEQGYVVGTCSDRLPSDQLATLKWFGEQPDFCIPKEMLVWVKRVLPGEAHLHVGDDPARDRAIALAAGWEHQYPWHFVHDYPELRSVRLNY